MKILPLIAVLTVVLLPGLASAQGFIPCDGANVNGLTACTECHFVQMGNTILKWLIGVLFVVFAVVLVMGGFGLVTSGGNPEAKNAAKSKLVNALIGIIIVLAAWLIVDTVMKGLLTGGTGEISGYGPWSEVKCGSQTVSSQAPAPTTPGTPGTPGTGTITPGNITHQVARDRLSEAGVIVTSTSGTVLEDCTGSTGCTSLNNIREDTVNQVINIVQACTSCQIQVTGGTESEAHQVGTGQTHGNGWKIDIQGQGGNHAEIDNFLMSNLTADGYRTGSGAGPRYRDSCGNEYVRESTHWDIGVTNGSCEI